MRIFRFSTWLLIVLAVPGFGVFNYSYSQSSSIDSIISPASLQQLVGVLASDDFEGRFTGTDQARKAAEFVAAEFKKAGATPVNEALSYFMHFDIPKKMQGGINVVAEITGKSKPEEIIIFSAHYDHIGTNSINPFKRFVTGIKPTPEDTIYNGANDNASGTAAIIALARYFSYLKQNERTIIFIAFSGEELGLLGSQSISSSIPSGKIKAVINVEMIGRPRTRKKTNAFITGSHLSDLRKLLNNALYQSNPALYGKKFFAYDNYTSENLFERSDNFWFASQGIPSHTIMASSPRDEFYHSTKDEVSTLDFLLMSRLVKAIALASAPLIDARQTPSRIDPRKME